MYLTYERIVNSKLAAVVVGEKALKEGRIALIELKDRRTGTVTKLAPADVVRHCVEMLKPAPPQ